MNEGKKHTTVQRIMMVFAVSVVLLGITIGYFSERTRERIERGVGRAMEQYVLQQANYVETVLNGQFIMLEAYAAYMGSFEIQERQAYLQSSRGIIEEGDFERMAIADVHGDSLTSDGISLNIAKQNYFISALEGKRAISRPFESDVEEGYYCVMLAVPVKNQKGQIIGVLGGSYSASRFGELFLENDYRDNTYSVLADEQGDAVVSSDHGVVQLRGEGIFEHLERAKFLDENSRDTVKEAAEKGKNLVSLVREYDQELYITQTPFGYNGWTLYAALERGKVDANYVAIKQYSGQMNRVFLVVFVGSLLALIWILRGERKEWVFENERIREEKLKLELSEERYRLIARDSKVIVFELNLNRALLDVNENFHKILGEVPDYHRFLGGNWVHPDDLECFRELISRSDGRRQTKNGNVRFRKADGDYLWFSVIVSLFADDDGTISRIIGKMTNIDRQKREVEMLQIQAQTDRMTGLYNKMAIQELIAKELSENDKGIHALFIVDIDSLKEINDTLGHAYGDEAIIHFAQVLKASFRSSDLIGRIGGDEFMVLMKNVGNRQQIRRRASALVENLAQKCIGEKQDYPIHGSLGIAVVENGSYDFETLYQRADKALYYVKRNGKSGYALYSYENQKEA